MSIAFEQVTELSIQSKRIFEDTFELSDTLGSFSFSTPALSPDFHHPANNPKPYSGFIGSNLYWVKKL